MTPYGQVAEAIAAHGRPNWVAYVPQHVRQQVMSEDLAELLMGARWSDGALTKQDRHEMILDWCEENTFAEVTIEQLQGVSGLSPSSVRNLITDRPDVFRKLRRGVWEVRDPKSDREADQR